MRFNFSASSPGIDRTESHDAPRPVHSQLALVGTVILLGCSWLHSSPSIGDVENWGAKEVENWLRAQDIAVHGTKRAQLNGRALLIMDDSAFDEIVDIPKLDTKRWSQLRAQRSALREAHADNLLRPEGDFWSFQHDNARIALLFVLLGARSPRLFLLMFVWRWPGSAESLLQNHLTPMPGAAASITVPQFAIAHTLNASGFREQNVFVVVCLQFMLLQWGLRDLGVVVQLAFHRQSRKQQAVKLWGDIKYAVQWAIGTYFAPSFVLSWVLQYQLFVNGACAMLRAATHWSWAEFSPGTLLDDETDPLRQ